MEYLNKKWVICAKRCALLMVDEMCYLYTQNRLSLHLRWNIYATYKLLCTVLYLCKSYQMKSVVQVELYLLPTIQIILLYTKLCVKAKIYFMHKMVYIAKEMLFKYCKKCNCYTFYSYFKLNKVFITLVCNIILHHS